MAPKHLQTMRNKHAITLEHLRMGALKGVILDADGSTLYNLYTEFGITRQDRRFALDPTRPPRCCEGASRSKRHIEDNLQGRVHDRHHVPLLGEDFFDALTTHPKVEGGLQPLAGRAGSAFGHTAPASPSAASPSRNIAAGRPSCRDVEQVRRRRRGALLPAGNAITFATYFAPADFNETANTLALPLYAKQEPRKFDRGTDLHTQSNPLPICQRPAVLVKLVMT